MFSGLKKLKPHQEIFEVTRSAGNVKIRRISSAQIFPSTGDTRHGN